MSWTRIIRRGVFVGSGSDGVSEPFIAELTLRLCGKPAEAVTVTYLGTATYDKEAPRTRQTKWFAEHGCRVLSPIIGEQATSAEVDVPAAKAALAAADIVIVSGGNTLYMLDRWRQCDLVNDIRDAALRGAVMCGGSAGAIAWFDAGHSDSLDPTTFRVPLDGKPSDSAGEYDPTSSGAAALVGKWKYVRVPGLGFLPGLACPHHDMTQSNGVPRADDFNAMVTPAERGICIDHWAALVIDAFKSEIPEDHGAYRVVAIPGKQGSVGGCDPGDALAVDCAVYVPQQRGFPGVWIVEASPDGSIAKRLAPWSGAVAELFRPASAPVAEDPALAIGRSLNPVN